MKYWKNGFYLQSQEDSVEITDDYWKELLEGQSNGKQITSNEEGYPILIERPAPTEDEYNAYQQERMENEAKAQRDSLISAIEWRRSRNRDEVALGLPPTEPLLPILKYIQALRDITKQAGYPSEVVWPTIPE